MDRSVMNNYQICKIFMVVLVSLIPFNHSCADFLDNLLVSDKKMQKLKKQDINVDIPDELLQKYRIEKRIHIVESKYIDTNKKIKWCFYNNSLFMASFIDENIGGAAEGKVHHPQLVGNAKKSKAVFCAGECLVDNQGYITKIDNDSASFCKDNPRESHQNLGVFTAWLKDNGLALESLEVQEKFF